MKLAELEVQYLPKILRMVLKLGEQNLISILETFFLKNKKIDLFFIFLQEKMALEQDVKYSEKQFLSSLNTYYDVNLEVINKYLEIIGKDRVYFTRQLMDNKMGVYNALSKFIQCVCISDIESLRKDIIPVLTQEFMGSAQHYMSLCKIIISEHTEFTEILLKTNNCNIRDFSIDIINCNYRNIILIKNYCEYLSNHNVAEFSYFENDYILRANPDCLIAYARHIPNSNKRKILRHLISLKNEEKHLVYFIEYFPEFSSLLPML